MKEIKAKLSKDEFLDLCEHQRSEAEISHRFTQLFDGYHTLSDLWTKNIKRNPNCNDISNFEYTIPICDKCDHQWGSICYYFENCREMLGYGLIGTPLFDLKRS